MTDLRVVSDLMTSPVVTLRPDQEINSALHVLLGHKISGAPVLDGVGHLVGILTEKDGLRAALEASYYRDWGKPVSTYMSADVTTMDPDLDLLTACEWFLDGPYRRFPVTRDGRLLGVVSRTDMLSGLAAAWG